VANVQRDREARQIYVLALAVTVPVIGAALGRGGRIGGGTTVCMLIASAALVGLVYDWRLRVRLPRARVVSSRACVLQVAEALVCVGLGLRILLRRNIRAPDRRNPAPPSPSGP
jgi:hypothetical protein